MKTIDELFPDAPGSGRLMSRMFDRQEIKDLLLEAWKQGMTDALWCVDNKHDREKISKIRDRTTKL